MSTVDLISTTLDTNPGGWRDQLQAIRNVTVSLEFLDSTPEEAQRRWQIPLIDVFQRVAFIDADNGGIIDIVNLCLRQSLSLLHLYPEDVNLLTR